ncbi:MAG: outer membrane beta-barrel protein, partial [Saprospiraceae bacterium]|nr:outer membrane beta-barrel protein [Saprospiraceae bacterium]
MKNNAVDKGWSAMQQKLDLEMPVKKRRRAFWWWMSLLLLPVATLAGWWLINDQKEQNPPAPLNVPVTSPKPTEDVAAGHVSPTLPVNHVAEASRPSIPKNHQPVQYTQKRPTTPPNLSASVNTPPTQTFQNQTIVTEFPQSRPTLDLTFLLLEPPRNIAYSETEKRPSPKNNPVANKADKKTDPFKPFWTFGATSIATTEQFSTVNGFSTGVTVDFALNRKWGFRTGVFYNIHTPQLNRRPVVAVDSDTYTYDLEGDVVARNVDTGTEVWNMPGTHVLADSLSGQVYIPVSRLQRIEFPVSVFWQAAKPLKVFAGLSLSKTLNTKADRLNYSGEYQLTLNDQVAEDQISDLSAEVYNIWNANAMLGLGLRVSPAFELGLQGTLPFKRFSNLNL